MLEMGSQSNKNRKMLKKLAACGVVAISFGVGQLYLGSQVNASELGAITQIQKGENAFYVTFATGEKGKISILNDHIFRYQIDKTGEFKEYPTPNSPNHIAKITVKSQQDFGLDSFNSMNLSETDSSFVLENSKLKITFSKDKATFSVFDKQKNKNIIQEVSPIDISDSQTIQNLKQQSSEQYFGGGTQNGRFTHKGTSIKIVNTNNWVDGGVASPNPFYWSSEGYGMIRNTWKPGEYDFGTRDSAVTKLTHKEGQFDAYYFINSSYKGILNDYYTLTGHPILMPEYGFYEAHLNAYNRDYWQEVSTGTSGAIQFEDGKYYKEFQPDSARGQGVLESLNGEKNNYQFSARAVIDRYVKNDMPLGWFLPNDGYGAGYGQTDSLDGDIQNLKEFSNYANSKGVEVGLWTQSNLHPADPAHPKKNERDIEKEVRDAGVKALKTDVAWVGHGYSFGLNGVEDAAKVFVEQTNGTVRPMIVSLDGWAGTQRHAGIWTGDQTGGEWEYIRFHVPTYIGTSLSGQPNVGSDMDGIFGGKNKEVNIRDYQWKAFTPIQLNMDGWGSNPKNPFAFDKEATDINRAYLKLKSMMMPYNYSIAHEAIDGLPMVRAMALAFPDDHNAYSINTQYQYMWGPNVLVAPIYNGTKDNEGNAIRNGVYLPDAKQTWIDLFTGEKYTGGRIIQNLKTPLWKLPVFVKDGAIIPLTKPNNNPKEIQRDYREYLLYPSGDSSFTHYEDDGLSTGYLKGQSATTKVQSSAPQSGQTGDLTVTVNPTKGSYENMVASRNTQFTVMASQAPSSVKVTANNQDITLKKVDSKEAFESGENVYYFDTAYQVNPYLASHAGEQTKQSALLVKVGKHDVRATTLQLTVKDFVNDAKSINANQLNTDLAAPTQLVNQENKNTTSSLALSWGEVNGATGYELSVDGKIYQVGAQQSAVIDGLEVNHSYPVKVRAVNAKGYSNWSEEITATTKEDPYRNTIAGVKAKASLPAQSSYEITKLVDKDLNSQWHTHWFEGGTANPAKGQYLTLQFDLGAEYQMDKIEYYPRNDGGSNGMITNVQYRTSKDGVMWSEYSAPIRWQANQDKKTLATNGQTYRYVQMKVLGSVGNFGSGNEMLFYKKDGTKGVISGDITNDGVVNENDVTSYRNYTGLEKKDSDFGGYVQTGDLNHNGMIDAYDIHYVLRQLDGGINQPNLGNVDGQLQLIARIAEDEKEIYEPGDTISFVLRGRNFENVNALSARMNFDSQLYELVEQPKVTQATQNMENFSKYRKHSDNSENLYFVLSNRGDKALLSGTNDLLTFKLKVKTTLNKYELQDLTFTLTKGLLVGQSLKSLELEKTKVVVPASKLVDKAALVKRQEQVESIKQSIDYLFASKDKKDAFDEGVKNIQQLQADNQATKEKIAAAVSNFDRAVKALDGDERITDVQGKLTDKVAQKESIQASVRYQNADAPLKEDYDQAVQKANQQLAQEKPNYDELKQALVDIESAFQKLNGLDHLEEARAELKRLIAQKDALVLQDNYTQADKQAKQAYQQALAKAIDVLNTNRAKPEEVISATKALEEAMLDLNGVDRLDQLKQTLQKELAAAQKVKESAQYQNATSSTQASFDQAMSQAKKVLANEQASPADFSQASSQLQSATKALVPRKVEKTALEDLVKQAQAKKAAEYTTDSWSHLQGILMQVEGLLAKKATTQAEIDQAKDQLGKALQSLEKKPVIVEVPGEVITTQDPLVDAKKDAKSAIDQASTLTDKEKYDLYKQVDQAKSAEEIQKIVGQIPAKETVVRQPMYRVYNPNSGEHLYTRDKAEYDMLGKIGWHQENIGWYSPEKGEEVYRLYNPNSGEHFYTMNADEYEHLAKVGWKKEGTAFYSNSKAGLPNSGALAIYRLFNPNEKGAGSHHFTTNLDEIKHLVSLGWKYEGLAFYGLSDE